MNKNFKQILFSIPQYFLIFCFVVLASPILIVLLVFEFMATVFRYMYINSNCKEYIKFKDCIDNTIIEIKNYINGG